MSNNYFEFKQFCVLQGNSAMKVSTDACLQAALFASFLKKQKGLYHSLLDIGAGTGLLSLMLQQELNFKKVWAVEIDKGAHVDCKANFENSPWCESLNAIRSDIRHVEADVLFDLIVTNPPFFKNNLRSHDLQRERARHEQTLNQEVLLEQMALRMAAYGYACVLYPVVEWQLFEEKLQESVLSLLYRYSIRPNSRKGVNRVLGILSKEKVATTLHEEVLIYNDDNHYTSEFKALLEPYYLAL